MSPKYIRYFEYKNFQSVLHNIPLILWDINSVKHKKNSKIK